jgi:ubiquinone/menaquinone biosynthesis C-methylase UbiE
LHHWENFYRNGAIATGQSQNIGNYDLEILQSWVSFFENCPQNARILDIATGNGAIASIAMNTAQKHGKNFEVHACDFAQIDPMRDVPNAEQHLTGISFHPGMAVEKLTFADAYFDAVSGQYALEYTDILASLKQLHRVLVPNGMAQFIIHHSNSELIRNSMTSLNEADFILQKTKIYRRLNHLVSAQLATPKFAETAGSQLLASIQSLKRALPEAQAAGGGQILQGTLGNIQQLLSMRTESMPVVNLEHEIKLAENNLRYWVRRQKDLLECAKGENGMFEIENAAKDTGFEVVSRDLQYHAGTNLVGWKLVLRRI